MTPNASQQYLTQQIMTASPAMLVFMLYDKAIGSLGEAIGAIENGDIDTRCRSNKRAMDIVSHMQTTLNMELGGEVSANLDRMFAHILERLPEVDTNNDPKPAHEVIGLLEPLRASWQELVNRGDEPVMEAARIAAEASSIKPESAAGNSQTHEPAEAIQPIVVTA